ncbi:MAG TPA: hypothetical protein VF921_10955 [Vicinamibacterales bacterium]
MRTTRGAAGCDGDIGKPMRIQEFLSAGAARLAAPARPDGPAR